MPSLSIPIFRLVGTRSEPGPRKPKPREKLSELRRERDQLLEVLRRVEAVVFAAGGAETYEQVRQILASLEARGAAQQQAGTLIR